MTVDVALPSAMTGPVPVIVEVAEDKGPAIKVTVPPVKVIGEARESVLVSALVDVSVHVEMPVVAFVGEHVP